MKEQLLEHEPYTRESVSQSYGRALLEIATERGVVDGIAQQVAQLLEMLKGMGLRQLLFSPSLTVSQRRGVIERLFEGRLDEELYRFIQVVNQKGRSALLVSIFQAFNERLIEQRGIIEVDLFAPQRLEGQQLKHVAESVSRSLGSEIVIYQYQDPSLIGGIKLRIGDRVIDGSVSAQLKLIKQRIIAAGRRRAREQAALDVGGGMGSGQIEGGA